MQRKDRLEGCIHTVQPGMGDEGEKTIENAVNWKIQSLFSRPITVEYATFGKAEER